MHAAPEIILGGFTAQGGDPEFKSSGRREGSSPRDPEP